jgi:hypothetical protein
MQQPVSEQRDDHRSTRPCTPRPHCPAASNYTLSSSPEPMESLLSKYATPDDAESGSVSGSESDGAPPPRALLPGALLPGALLPGVLLPGALLPGALLPDARLPGLLRGLLLSPPRALLPGRPLPGGSFLAMLGPTSPISKKRKAKLKQTKLAFFPAKEQE